MRATIIGVIAIVACSATERYAEADLPGAGVVVGVRPIHSHPFLAEYDRELISTTLDGPQTQEIFPDTGGYPLVNVYRQGTSSFLLLTKGDHQYSVDARDGTLTTRRARTTQVDRPDGGFSIHHLPPNGSEFVGAFDFDAEREWRFIPARERPERVVGKLYTDR